MSVVPRRVLKEAKTLRTYLVGMILEHKIEKYSPNNNKTRPPLSPAADVKLSKCISLCSSKILFEQSLSGKVVSCSTFRKRASQGGVGGPQGLVFRDFAGK